MQIQVFDDDARFHDRCAAVEEHGKPLQWPQRLDLRYPFGLVRPQKSEFEGGVVFVQRDQYLLAVRGKGMRVEGERQEKSLHTVWKMTTGCNLLQTAPELQAV